MIKRLGDPTAMATYIYIGSPAISANPGRHVVVVDTQTICRTAGTRAAIYDHAHTPVVDPLTSWHNPNVTPVQQAPPVVAPSVVAPPVAVPPPPAISQPVEK
ncbi:hypothetical protein ACLKA6_013051 [Drosophila palustris]